MRVRTEQVITREVEAPERNVRPRTCFDVAVEDLLLRFPGEKELCHYGEYRTKLQILGIYDAFQHAIYLGESYKTLLDPPPGLSADEHGNFLRFPEWKPGQPKPPNWPPHVYSPKEVAEH